MDRSYQAMPESCALLERARHDAEFGSCLEWFHSWAPASAGVASRYAKAPVVIDFLGEMQQTMKNNLGIENRFLDLGRHYDIMMWLLCKYHREIGDKDGLHWAEKAIVGGDVLNLKTQTTIGSPIRFLSPLEVLYVTENLESLCWQSLLPHWNPRAMRDAAVYKICGDEGEENLTYLKEDFENLQVFYAQAAAHGEGVLAFWG